MYYGTFNKNSLRKFSEQSPLVLMKSSRLLLKEQCHKMFILKISFVKLSQTIEMLKHFKILLQFHETFFYICTHTVQYICTVCRQVDNFGNRDTAESNYKFRVQSNYLLKNMIKDSNVYRLYVIFYYIIRFLCVQ